jgi:hypothetical protein
VLSLSISIGIVIFLDLRLLRLTFRETPISRIMHSIGPWMIGGMFIMVFTGILLFCAQATSAYTNTFFRIKMLLLVAGAVNAGVYQWKYYPRMADWDLSDKVPTGVRVIAVLSIIFWFAVIVCGRTMAYEI